MGILKEKLEVIGWEGLVSWRAKQLLAHYRLLKSHYGKSYQYIKDNSTRLNKLRRNRTLVKAVGKQFADYLQTKLDLSVNCKVDYFPSWYDRPSAPYRFRVFKPRQWSVMELESPYMMNSDYDEYSLTPIRFGNVQGKRMFAAYWSEGDTVLISHFYLVSE